MYKYGTIPQAVQLRENQDAGQCVQNVGCVQKYAVREGGQYKIHLRERLVLVFSSAKENET